MGKLAMPLEAARYLAQLLVRLLEPFSERIEIAGSIRRGKEIVGDVELLYIPKTALTGQLGLFGGADEEDLLEKELLRWIEAGFASKRLNEAGNPIGFGKMNKALVHEHSGMGIDVFRTTPENWGMAMVVRTGPADWNVEMMAAFQRLDTPAHAYGGVTGKRLESIDCPDEETVFRLLGIGYLEPNRRDASLLKAVGR